MRRYIEYLILIAVTFYTAVLYRSTAFILVGYVEIIGGVLLFGYFLCLAGKISVRILPSSDMGEKGKRMPVELLVSNRSFLPVGKVKIKIQEVYPMFGEKRTTTFWATVPAGGRNAGETRICLGYLARHSGRLTLRIRNVRIYDFLGMLPFPLRRKRMGQEACLSIFPDTVSIPIVMKRDTRDYGQERAEQAVRGEEQPPESWEIRTYQPGDRLRAIHWKLSAKTEELMVNETTTEAGCPVYIFLDYQYIRNGKRFHTKKACAEALERFLEIILSLSLSLVENGCKHCLVWFDSQIQDVCRMEIYSQEDIYLFFQQMKDFGSAPEGMTVEEWYRLKYRGSFGNTRLTLNGQFQCLCNGEVMAEYQGKNIKELLQAQELFV